jgi:predicted transcriptional regulator
MSADDTSDGERGDNESIDPHDNSVSVDGETDDSGSDVRDRLEQEADRALDQFDESLIDLLSWILETDTRARIYVHLRQHPDSTSEEIAEGTGLYPSTVREALASLHEDGTVTRSKRQNAGAGNNPYEYSAIPPSELVSDIVDDVQRHLNTVFNLDRYLDSSDADDADPVTITVTEETESDDVVDTGDDQDTTASDESDTDNESPESN